MTTSGQSIPPARSTESNEASGPATRRFGRSGGHRCTHHALSSLGELCGKHAPPVLEVVIRVETGAHPGESNRTTSPGTGPTHEPPSNDRLLELSAVCTQGDTEPAASSCGDAEDPPAPNVTTARWRCERRGELRQCRVTRRPAPCPDRRAGPPRFAQQAHSLSQRGRRRCWSPWSR